MASHCMVNLLITNFVKLLNICLYIGAKVSNQLLIPILRTLNITNRELLLFVVVVIMGLAAAGYLYSLDKYSLTYYGDAVSHLVIARKIVDFQSPGIHQLGTVWLPLPHILLLPFVLIEPLFRTGFAGLIVSLPSLAITSVLLYRMIKMYTGFSVLAFAAGLLYASNPNIMYMGLTAMTEAPFMLFFVASAYYFQRWYQNLGNKNNFYDLGKFSVFVSLATLCRYEAWLLPFFVIVFVIMLLARGRINIKHKSIVILISTISLSGIAFWLIWNAYYYDDALAFANIQYYSAASQALERPFRENLFLQPMNVASIYVTTAIAIYGFALLVAAILGYILQRRFDGSKETKAYCIFFALPPAFTVVSITLGFAEMNQWWLNARFLMLLAPLIIYLAFVMVKWLPSRIRKKSFAIAGVIGILFLHPIATQVFGVVTFIDAKEGFIKTSPFSIQTGEALGSIYDGGRILMLTGSGEEHKIMFSSGIALRAFDDLSEPSTLESSFREPWSYVKWIVISSALDPDTEGYVKYWIDRQEQLAKYFDIVYQNQYHKIMLRK